MFAKMQDWDEEVCRVHLLSKLALTVPVATITVERAFLMINFIKNKLRNRMCDQLINDCLVTYIGKDVFDGISNEAIMHRFQNMMIRQGQLERKNDIF